MAGERTYRVRLRRVVEQVSHLLVDAPDPEAASERAVWLAMDEDYQTVDSTVEPSVDLAERV